MKKLYYFLLLGTFNLNAQIGSYCDNPIIIGSLPYTTNDDTANYGDNYDPQTTTHPVCTTTQYGNYYHGGNDVIYSYTPTVNGLIKVEIPAALGWTGMFIYNNCTDIGITYAACATGSSAGARTINNFAVTAGQTYYIYISSWPTPQTVTYTLNVTDATLGIDLITDSKNISIYPNPASSNLYFESNLAIESVKIFDTKGQLIASKNVTQNMITVSELQTGFYLIELETNEGIKINRNFIKN
jgi:hypothetical protein